MGHKRLFLLILFIPIFFSYNNCSQSTGNLSGAGGLTLSSESLAVGFLGQQPFDFFSPDPQCQTERLDPIEKLIMDARDFSAQIEKSSCTEQAHTTLDFSDVLFQHYNSYVAFYDNKVWVASQLHKDIQNDPNQSLYYLEYCFNTVVQMDVTIQYLSDSNNPSEKDWVVLTLYGDRAQSAGVHFNGGSLVENSDGSKIFTADNGLLEIEISKEYEPGKKRALYQKRDGIRIPMTCWFYKPN